MTRFAGVSLLLVCLLAPAGAAEPEATAVACQAVVKVDGKLDEECWRRAPVLDDFHVLGQEQERSDSTYAKLAYDPTWLYLGVSCRHPALREVKPKFRRHDDSVHSDEACELFLGFGDPAAPYCHFKLNCANVKAEQLASADGFRQPRWDCPWLSAVRQDGQGWTAELALPLYVLASYGDLGNLRLNLTRHSLLPHIDRQGVVVSWREQWTTWAPLLRTFHEPDLFRRLRGISLPRPQVPFLVTASHERVSAYRRLEKGYAYDVSLELRGYNDRSGKVTVKVVDVPSLGQTTSVTREVEVPGNRLRPITLTVPVALPVHRSTTIMVIDAISGAVYWSSQAVATQAQDLFSAWLDRNFYSFESQATVWAQLGLPERDLRETVLTLRRGSAVLAQVKRPGALAALPFPLKPLPLGRHQLTVRWTRLTGGDLYVQNLELVKRAPRPAGEWKVDRAAQVILRDGQPFFPVGMIMGGIGSADEADMARVAQAGFNTLAHWSYAKDPADIGAYLAAARKHGLMVLGRLEACNKPGVDRSILEKYVSGAALERVVKEASWGGLTRFKSVLIGDPDLGALPREAKSRLYQDYYESTRDVILESVRVSAAYDNCLGFNHFDEPLLSVFAQDVPGRDLYHRVREVGEGRPVFLLYSSYIPEGRHALDWCDALGTDPYWIPGGPAGRNSPNFVAKITTLTRRRADEIQGPTWIVPMAELWSGVHKRPLTAPEQYCQSYLALIHGAKALIYFVYPVMHQSTWEALSGVARQMQTLGPLALTPALRQEIIYEPGRFDAEKDEYPDVQVALKRRPGGGTVLLAANSQPYPVAVTYTLTGLRAAGEVGQLFAEQRHAFPGGRFQDRLEAYGTRAYLLPEPAGPGPVQGRVAMQAEKTTAYTPEVEVPRSGRSDRRNVMPNPSLEEASLPGWPDYFRPWYSQPLVGSPDPGWGQDPDNPFAGQYSLRITRNGRTYNGFYAYISPQHARPTRYVFSVYLRGQREGLRAMVGGGPFPWQQVTLGTTWQRYSVTGLMPARADRETMIQLRLMDEGRIWADAVQVEQGETPTEFVD